MILTVYCPRCTAEGPHDYGAVVSICRVCRKPFTVVPPEDDKSFGRFAPCTTDGVLEEEKPSTHFVFPPLRLVSAR